jgi:septal ring factor EnvC (AmiA/AmiB activator)
VTILSPSKLPFSTKQTRQKSSIIRCYSFFLFDSLHKSLSQEANLRDQFNNTLENITVQLKERDGNIELAQKENNILLAQLKAITMEKNDLAQQLGKMQLSKQEADATIEK